MSLISQSRQWENSLCLSSHNLLLHLLLHADLTCCYDITSIDLHAMLKRKVFRICHKIIDNNKSLLDI
jgi:hypothetical protein